LFHHTRNKAEVGGLIPKVSGYFSNLPNDFGKGSIPRPPVEIGRKLLEYFKQNVLPIAGIGIGIIGMVI